MKRIGWLMVLSLCLTTGLAAVGTARKVTQILTLNRFGFEISVGAALDRPQFLPLRATGTDELMRQYADGVGAELVEDGRFGENLLALPLRFAAGYRLDHYWTLKAGLSVSTGGVTSSKSYALTPSSGLSEQFDLSLRNRLTLISPFVEVERNFGRFSLFAGIGMQWGRLAHTLDLDSASFAYAGNLTEEITATGTGPLAFVGGAYRFPLGEKTSLLVRLELRFSRINRWSGDKNSVESDNAGNRQESAVEGDLLRYEWNPYGSGWVGYWDLDAVTGDGVFYRDAASLSSRLSGIRFSLGICF